MNLPLVLRSPSPPGSSTPPAEPRGPAGGAAPPAAGSGKTLDGPEPLAAREGARSRGDAAPLPPRTAPPQAQRMAPHAPAEGGALRDTIAAQHQQMANQQALSDASMGARTQVRDNGSEQEHVKGLARTITGLAKAHAALVR